MDLDVAPRSAQRPAARVLADAVIAARDEADVGEPFAMVRHELARRMIVDSEKDEVPGVHEPREVPGRHELAQGSDGDAEIGLAEIVRAGYPDPFSLRKGHRYFDERSSKDAPTWYTVDVAFVERFPEVVPLGTLRTTPGLERMLVIQRGSRLSIQPVTRREYDIIARLGHAAGQEPGKKAR